MKVFNAVKTKEGEQKHIPSSLILSLNMLVCVRDLLVSEWMCVSLHMMWKPEVNSGYCPSLLSVIEIKH